MKLQLSLLFIAVLMSSPTVADITEDLKVVGEARLKVFLWKIYDSSLYSESGFYRGLEPSLTLQINYLRNVNSRQLLNRTQQEWQKMSIATDIIDDWLMELSAILPDISEGESLTVQVEDDLSSSFYYNSTFLGNVGNPDFTQSFLAIWLSENSSYPELQAQLVGMNE